MNCNNDFEWDIPKQENFAGNVPYYETNNASIAKLFLEGDENSILNFLQKNANGRNIPLINQNLSEVLRDQSFDYSKYWSFIRILISFNASLFMTTIYKNSVPSLIPPINEISTLNEIVDYAFKSKEKLKYAIGILGPVRSQLSYNQKQFILSSCLNSSSLDLLKYACDSLQMPPSIVVNFLRNKLDNDVALFTLYMYYHEASSRGDVSENTIIEVFSYAYINMLLLEMKKMGGKSQDIAYVIEFDLFKDSKCKNKSLYKLIQQKGHNGFSLYYAKKALESQTKNHIDGIVLNTKKYTFKPIGELYNYYILLNTNTNLHALLPKILCDSYNRQQLHAYIYQFDKTNQILYVNQKPLPKEFNNPSILKIGDTIEISFSLRNGNLYPRVRNLTNIFKVKVANINDATNYKLRYKAVIRKMFNSFSYLVEIVDLA